MSFFRGPWDFTNGIRTLKRPQAERLELRLSSQQKRLIEQGAAFQGLSISDFALQSALQAAKHLTHEQGIITLSPEGQQAFLAALEALPEPKQALKEATGSIRSTMWWMTANFKANEKSRTRRLDVEKNSVVFTGSQMYAPHFAILSTTCSQNSVRPLT